MNLIDNRINGNGHGEVIETVRGETETLLNAALQLPCGNLIGQADLLTHEDPGVFLRAMPWQARRNAKGFGRLLKNKFFIKHIPSFCEA